jgi:DNA-binding XRE family transcriptional regulator
MEAEVARFFRDLRAALQMSQAQAAQRLATRTDIIAALEAGDVSVLPPWPECCRVVRMYTAPVGLDPRPILHSLETLLSVAARTPKPAPKRAFVSLLSRQKKPAQPARSKPAAIAAVSANVGRLLRGRNGRALFAVAVPVGLLVLLTQTSVLGAAVAQLPPSVARIVRGAQDYVTVQLAPVRDGLRWIDVRDPRSRRSDKLRTTAQSD